MIVLKSKQEVTDIASASKIVAECLILLKQYVRAGMTTMDLDAFVEKEVEIRGGKPAFKGYRGFPANLCVSINREVVHGVPSRHRVIMDGDIVSMDLGVIYNNFYGDAAVTVAIGDVPEETKRLIRITEESLYRGIERAHVRGRVSDISHAIQTHVEDAGYSVVTSYVGHGIGRALHEEPEVPNFGPPGLGPILREGMVLAIEPMVNIGKGDISVLDDKWTVVTSDGSLSAHFEHTVAITENGPQILTKI